MKVGFSVKDRLSLSGMFPTKGDILQQILVKEISKTIEISKEEREKIGDYYISRCENGIWIQHKSGEGAQFCEKDVAGAIDKFYKDNF